MTKKKPYKRSIWPECLCESKCSCRILSENYAYSSNVLDEASLQAIAQVQRIEAAKKRTPPISMKNALLMHNFITDWLTSSEFTVSGFTKLLEDITVYGAGIRTAVCIFAVLSEGQYPPLDEKVIAAAESKGMCAEACKNLKSTRENAVAEAYVNCLFPLWESELKSQKCSPAELDKQWGLMS